MESDYNKITVHYEEGGKVLAEELGKEIISSDYGWVTILFKLRHWENVNNRYSTIYYHLRKYENIKGRYHFVDKMKITGIPQAKQVIAALEKFIEE